jgi:uncharacterized protein YcbX
MRQQQGRNFQTCDKQDCAVDPIDLRKRLTAASQQDREKQERGEDHADETDTAVVGNHEHRDEGGKCGQWCAGALGDPIKTSHSGPESTDEVSHVVK